MRHALPFARGAALVERIVARIGARPDAVPFEGPFVFPDGRPLPSSLARFLRFDGRWLVGGALAPISLAEAWAACIRRIRRQGAEEAAAWVAYENDAARRTGSPPPHPEVEEAPPSSDGLWSAERLAGALERPLDGACVLLPMLGTHPYFLYVGEAADAGEYPVLGVGPKTYELFLAFPGFDFYLNHRFGAERVDAEADWYRGLLEAQARANLHGSLYVLDGDFEPGAIDAGTGGGASDDDIPF